MVQTFHHPANHLILTILIQTLPYTTKPNHLAGLVVYLQLCCNRLKYCWITNLLLISEVCKSLPTAANYLHFPKSMG